jgi:hypothetical protein
MNLLTYRVPTHIYRSDACEHCLGGYSATGNAWRWEIPTHLQDRAHISLLEFLGCIIGPWIDIIEGALPANSITLAMSDSTNAAGWLRKSNFTPEGEDDATTNAKLIAARKHASLHINAKATCYSQWFPGKQNIVSDCLSRDFHIPADQLTQLLLIAIPEQIPPNFRIRPLPLEISSWLRLLLGKIPAKTRPATQRKTSELSHGLVGSDFSSALNTRKIQEWRNSNAGNESLSCQPLHKLCATPFTLKTMLKPWLQAQSVIPWTTWHRPSGMITASTRGSTMMDKRAQSFFASTKVTKPTTNRLLGKKRSLHESSLNSEEIPKLPKTSHAPNSS